MTPENSYNGDALYRTLARAIYLAAGIFLGLWLLDAMLAVVLFFAIAFIFAIALNPPVMWLEAHRMPRAVAVLLVCGVILAVTVGLGWLVVPRLIHEASGLAEQVPEYVTLLQRRAADGLKDYPAAQERLRFDPEMMRRLLPSMQVALTRIGRYSLSLLAGALFGLVLACTVIYTLTRPLL